MAERILGGSCGNVRLFSVYHLPLFLSYSLFLLVLSLFFFSCASFSPLWRTCLFSPFGPARRFVPPSRPPALRPLLTPFARSSSSSRLTAFGYHLGHRGHPPRCTRYMVCPIFTHGKSTLKKRWAPARSSLPSLHRDFALLLSYITAASQ